MARNPVFVKKGPSFMNYSTKAALGIKDPYLKLDTAHFKDAIEGQGNQIIVHLVQSYPLHCPRCGQLMLRNGFKLVKILGPSLHYEPTIWSIRKQNTFLSHHRTVHKRLPRWPKLNHHHISQAIKLRIMMQLTANESQTDIAKELGISDWTVRRVILNLDQSFKPNYHWLPRHIAFDDFKSGRFTPSGMSMKWPSRRDR